MPVNDELGRRMKEYYEYIPKNKLMRRTPVAIRIDGKAFRTFTKGLAKPFDDILVKSMQETMKYLCENIQGCVFGYTQSDEITLILVDYKKLNSESWFDYEVQKMCSVSASMATMAFNKFFDKNVSERAGIDLYDQILDRYCKAIDKGAMFDARVFNIPKEEVTNLIYWRQLDAIRNSIQMVGQAYFSTKELDHKSQGQILEMLMSQKGINWEELPAHLRRGSCSVRSAATDRPHWIIDTEIPVFRDEGREYIDKLIDF